MGDAATANLRRQLQLDDPSTPARGLSQLVQWWSDWRARQAEAPDPMNPPVGFSAPTEGLSGLAAILRDAAGETLPPRGLQGLIEPMQGDPGPSRIFPGGGSFDFKALVAQRAQQMQALHAWATATYGRAAADQITRLYGGYLESNRTPSDSPGPLIPEHYSAPRRDVYEGLPQGPKIEDLGPGWTGRREGGAT